MVVENNILDKFIVNAVIGWYCNQKLYLLEHIFPLNIKPGFDIINSWKNGFNETYHGFICKCYT